MSKQMTERRGYPGMPRWVRLLGAIAVVALVLFVAAHLAGGIVPLLNHGAHH